MIYPILETVHEVLEYLCCKPTLKKSVSNNALNMRKVVLG